MVLENPTCLEEEGAAWNVHLMRLIFARKNVQHRIVNAFINALEKNAPLDLDANVQTHRSRVARKSAKIKSVRRMHFVLKVVSTPLVDCKL